jgi:hypothetical protein
MFMQPCRSRFILAIALGLVPLFTAPPPARADANDGPPSVPADLQPPAGSKLFREGHAVGTQNYICLPAGAGYAWTFFGPQATLFNDDGGQIVTHFLSANPDEAGLPRPTWQDSKDTSAVWAKAIFTLTDANYVAAGAIPWLKLEVVGWEPGPDGGDRMTQAGFIQRVNTSGGVAPSTGCASATDVGKKALVPYTADYFFYRPPAPDA